MSFLIGGLIGMGIGVLILEWQHRRRMKAIGKRALWRIDNER